MDARQVCAEVFEPRPLLALVALVVEEQHVLACARAGRYLPGREHALPCSVRPPETGVLRRVRELVYERFGLVSFDL